MSADYDVTACDMTSTLLSVIASVSRPHFLKIPRLICSNFKSDSLRFSSQNMDKLEIVPDVTDKLPKEIIEVSK